MTAAQDTIQGMEARLHRIASGHRAR